MNERRRRSEIHSNNKKKSDRILNILITIVSILIIIKLFFLLTDTNDIANENEKDKEKTEQAKKHDENIKTDKDDEHIVEEVEIPEVDDTTNEKSQNNEVVTKVENDQYVEEVIINPNWKAIPTEQTGTHVSSFEKGSIDYEEKLQAIRYAVNLEDNNIIYWSVRNNGSADSAISIISSKDKSEKYRVTIDWINNVGWKPVKVEKLKTLDGLVNN